MRTRICSGIAVFTLLVATQLNADYAPESIDGMVLRSTVALVGTSRSASQATHLFYADGSYSRLLDRTYYFLGHPAYVLNNDGRTIKGTYTYAKTSANTATISYHKTDSDSVGVVVLNFSSPTTGGRTEGGYSFYFSLTEMLSVESAPAMNISLRGEVRPNRPLIGGFVVPGLESSLGSWWNPSGGREVLIRVVGPSLAQFDVEDIWADPDFELFRDGKPFQQAQHLREDHYGDWWETDIGADGTESIITPVSRLERIFEHVGAFPLLERSKDAAQVERLPPGNYTVVAKAEEGDPGGEALIEVYFLP